MQWDDAGFPLSHASPQSAPSSHDITIPAGTPSSALTLPPSSPGQAGVPHPLHPVTRPPWPWPLICHTEDNRGGGCRDSLQTRGGMLRGERAASSGLAATQRVQRQEHVPHWGHGEGAEAQPESPEKAHNHRQLPVRHSKNLTDLLAPPSQQGL